MSAVPCSHLDQVEVRELPAEVAGCEDCLRTGGKWLHLRICLTCGHVGCCDNSPNRHATKHFHQSHHPVIRSYEPGEEWGYCYPHDLFVEELPARPGERPARHYDPPGE